MAKGKSSASAGTRKKHARRAAGPSEDPLPREKKLKTKEKGKKKEPRQKIYIAPVKPAPIQPDPLETLGLAHRLPPDLLVVLRSFTKKSALTKMQALEKLQSGWVDKCLKEGEDSPLVYTLVDMLPVWLHHFSALFVHPSRRIRLLTAGLHLSFLQIGAVRDQIFFFLRETASTHQIENILGTWCMASHDIDRGVATCALKSWEEAITLTVDDSRHLVLGDHLLPHLLAFAQRALLDPGGVYSYLNPIPPVIVPTPPKRVPGRSVPVVSLRKDDVEQVARAKSDELEEEEQDRKARLRVGAFGAIKWVLEISKSGPSDDLIKFLSNPALWSSLHHAKACPFIEVESFGFNQPSVRKSAWTLVQSLLRHRKEYLEPLLPVLSTGILRSAWVELDTNVQSIMWQPLLTFLKEFPRAWELEAAHASSKDELVEDGSDSEDEDEGEDEGEHEPEVKKESIATSATIRNPSPAYQEFLQFLQLGCSGAPVQGYPTVVIILSTISSSIIASSPSSPPLTDFFISFWAALGGGALSSLQRRVASAAFLSSLLECMVFLVKRVCSDTSGNHAVLLLGSPQAETSIQKPSMADIDAEAQKLVSGEFGKVWQELVSKRLKTEDRVAAKSMAQTLVSLDNINRGLFQAAWDPLAIAINTAAVTSPSLVASVLKVFDDQFEDETAPKVATRTLIAEILQSSIIRCEKVFSTEETDSPVTGAVAPLVDMLDTFGERLFRDPEFSRRIDDMAIHKAYVLLTVSPSLLLAYLSHRQDEQRCLHLWHALLSGMLEHPDVVQQALSPLLDTAQKGLLPKYLRPKADELDALVEELLTRALGGSVGASELSVVRQLMQTSDYFLSEKGFHSLFKSVVTSFTRELGHALRDLTVSLASFETSLELARTVFEPRPDLLSSGDIVTSILPDVFIFAYLLPRCYEPGNYHSVTAARDLWALWLASAPEDIKKDVFTAAKSTLKALLRDSTVQPSPEHILQVVSEDCAALDVNLIRDILPSRRDIDSLLDDLSPDPIDPSLAVLEPLLPPASEFRGKHPPAQTYDSKGHSSYARVVGALLQHCIEDRQSAKENMWALRHFLALSLYASDFILIPSGRSPVFESKALSTSLTEVVAKVQQVATYLLTSSSDDGWRLHVITAVQDEKLKARFEGLPRFVVDLIEHSKSVDTIRESRILKNVLQHILDDTDKAEAELWILFSRKIESIAPRTSMAIISSITEFAPEPPRLDRYRNELAAALLGIPATKADKEGLLTLRRLAATAPDPNSDVVFLPQLRAVNVVKACQQWVASDEDVDEEVESAMTLIFFHLVPILQNVPGAHWDLIFDVIESNLENCSLTEDDTLVTLARTLRLIISIQDFTSTNKSLRADWHGRQMPILTWVRDFATAQLDGIGASAPRSTCRELVLSIVQDLPESLIDQDTLPKMCHLLSDPSTDVQKMAYQHLQGAAKKHTEHLVIEAGVDADANVKVNLPIELIEVLQLSLNQADSPEQDEQHIFGYLLGWMILFDLFVDASLKVRSSYIDQLRSLDIIATHFIPNIFGVLHLDEGVVKAFKLDVWHVDDYYVQLYEPGTSFSLQLLAAHLYYRALLTVPSLIHTWVLDCKDRQLSSSIATYTSQHFSPVIIRTELAHLKSPEAMAELVDDNLTIKVATTINEVTASYLVDDHQLEIKLKIPSDWPLHKIEIKDLKRVGVDEKRWRAWVLAVQQTIWSHNGRIVDGLSLFKKNVTLHFEGQVECAICYSIISVMDATLPRKPCKTCKNRFHNACLYKWFNTSHSSSCPLCRSDIL